MAFVLLTKIIMDRNLPHNREELQKVLTGLLSCH